MNFGEGRTSDAEKEKLADFWRDKPAFDKEELLTETEYLLDCYNTARYGTRGEGRDKAREAFKYTIIKEETPHFFYYAVIPFFETRTIPPIEIEKYWDDEEAISEVGGMLTRCILVDKDKITDGTSNLDFDTYGARAFNNSLGAKKFIDFVAVPKNKKNVDDADKDIEEENPLNIDFPEPQGTR